jgi:ABC-2 type transport system permease protein
VLNDVLLLVLFFASGMMVALDDMPGWIAALGRFLPVTHPIASARTLMLDGGALAWRGDGGLAWMVTLAAAWFAAGAVAFHRAAAVVRRDGTLVRY